MQWRALYLPQGILGEGLPVDCFFRIGRDDFLGLLPGDDLVVGTRLDAHKKKTAYEAGEILNVDDITVTAYYEDGYSEQITGYTTNAD